MFALVADKFFKEEAIAERVEDLVDTLQGLSSAINHAIKESECTVLVGSQTRKVGNKIKFTLDCAHHDSMEYLLTHEDGNICLTAGGVEKWDDTEDYEDVVNELLDNLFTKLEKMNVESSVYGFAATYMLERSNKIKQKPVFQTTRTPK